MHTRSARWFWLAACGLCASLGCEHCFHRRACPPAACAPGCPPAPCPAPAPYVPPAGVPTQPVPAPVGVPAQPYQPSTIPPPVTPPPGGPAPSNIRGYGPPPLSVPTQAEWRPPTTETAEPPREPVRLLAPEFNPATPPKAAVQPERPASPQERPATPSLPVGIPQFDYAMEHVANGLKPLLDGLDWLKDNNFRAVLHIRQPGEDDSAERRQVEKRGLKFLSLEVSPVTLSRTTVDDFNRIIGDAGSYPLFVYDRDGMLAGALWYLHFRTVDQASDETARSRAARFGLREDQNGEQKAMWLAIQKFLGEQKR